MASYYFCREHALRIAVGITVLVLLLATSIFSAQGAMSPEAKLIVLSEESYVSVTYEGSGGPGDITSYNNLFGLWSPSYNELFWAKSTSSGTNFDIGYFPSYTELIFFIKSPDGTFLSGPAARSPDNTVHAAITDVDFQTLRIGFEDMWNGGDRDYNDVTVLVKGDFYIIPPNPQKPDFIILPEDISFSNNNPNDGDIVEIQANIHNFGISTNSDVAVGFYDGDPESGGALISLTTIIGGIGKEGNIIKAIQWDTTGKEGIHNIYVKIDPENLIEELYEDNNNANKEIIIGKEPNSADFTISEVKPIQVVWDADINSDGKIDLVAGKSTMVSAIVDIENNALSGNINIDLLLGEGVADTVTKTVDELKQNNKVEFYFTPNPWIIGDNDIVVRIDIDGKITKSEPVQVTIVETKDFNIEYTVINPNPLQDFNSPNANAFKNTVEQNNKFIKSIYPIRESGIQSTEGSISSIIGSQIEIQGGCGSPIGSKWYFTDLYLLQMKSVIYQKDFMIGIADSSYFEGLCYDNGVCVKGFTHRRAPNAMITEVGEYQAVAHEMGHTFGLLDGYRVNPDCTVYAGDHNANGFWVDGRKQIENAIDFMGSAPPKGTIPMDTLNENDRRWIDNPSYYYLFNVKKVKDPNILLVNGLIGNDDSIELGDWYYLENRMIEDIPTGDYSVELFDKSNQLISKTPFDAYFFLNTEPFGKVEIDTTLFILPISYPDNVIKIQIKHNDKILTEINPNSKLLHDAVNLIPDNGFVKNPDQNRKALHNKIDATEKMLEGDNINGAKEKLQNDIRDKLVKWLVDDYIVEDPLQLSKDEVIKLVDEIITRLDSI